MIKSFVDRFYCADDSFLNRFKVYENGQFVCSGLTLTQAQDFCKGAELFDLNIKELCF